MRLIPNTHARLLTEHGSSQAHSQRSAKNANCFGRTLPVRIACRIFTKSEQYIQLILSSDRCIRCSTSELYTWNLFDIFSSRMITDSIIRCVRSMSDASYCSLEDLLLESDECHFFPSPRCEWEWRQTLEKRLSHVFVRIHLAIALDPAGPVSLRWPDLRIHWHYQWCDGLTGLQSEKSKEESLLDLLHCL